MNRLHRDVWTGVGVAVLGLVLALVAVPGGVVTPRNVRIAVLSPAFWPNILAWLLVLFGVVLAVQALRRADSPGDAPEAAPGWTGLTRLALLSLGVVLFCIFATKLGLVWAAALLFAGTVLLTGTEHRITAVAVTLLLPLALFFFFSHVAGVPIPQGLFVRLP